MFSINYLQERYEMNKFERHELGESIGSLILVAGPFHCLAGDRYLEFLLGVKSWKFSHIEEWLSGSGRRVSRSITSQQYGSVTTTARR